MFDSIKMDSTVFLTEDTAGPRCHISLCLTYAKGKNAEYINDSIIRSGVLCPDYFSITPQKISVPEAADSFMTRYLNDYKVDYGSYIKQTKLMAVHTIVNILSKHMSAKRLKITIPI